MQVIMNGCIILYTEIFSQGSTEVAEFNVSLGLYT